MGSNPYQSSGDTGSQDTGINLNAHITGNPIRQFSSDATVGHTWLIIVVALALLWLLAFTFRSIRM